MLERNWNKMDLVEKLEMNKYIYLNTSQRAATGILFYVSNETRIHKSRLFTISKNP